MGISCTLFNYQSFFFLVSVYFDLKVILNYFIFLLRVLKVFFICAEGFKRLFIFFYFFFISFFTDGLKKFLVT